MELGFQAVVGQRHCSSLAGRQVGWGDLTWAAQ